MYCVGLTGNLASGKSTILQFFKDLGAYTLSADGIARELTSQGKPAFTQIVKHFGKNIVNNTGALDRPLLRELIFTDKLKKKWLEELLHPLIRCEIIKRIKAHNEAYAVIEIPLLDNRADYPYLDRVLVVMADLERQIYRVMQRDHCSREQAIQILDTQPDALNRQKIADDLVLNNASEENLLINIKKLHHRYLQLAKQKSS